MRPVNIPAPTEFETKAHALVGRLVFLYSRLDINLALYVANRHGTAKRNASIRELESTSFKSKLEWLLPAVAREYPSNSICKAEWQEWLDSAEALRKQRNNLVHGRWGIYEHHQQVSNIIGIPGSAKQVEVKYSLVELAAEVEQAVFLSQEFYRLAHKWPA